ncbi:hypothetical protein JL49_22810 [Pseudoalteromonas luteoviolacea]|uniref:Glycosyl hydrolase family 13 catalytic domain-containing protein n=1 Tax=Pseudoalteromonas luteoviolacea NCIMB 1942 TaxID=1365253 RepID=A0A167BY31_9GAMM|nr:hypothetical protein N482_02080 [Pseudoalteromonas luteoviolacea NCIMB 1942]KZW98522.1 hypothetical protein JL49_22810 [Pseudoalteromonas luteoviolacea]
MTLAPLIDLRLRLKQKHSAASVNKIKLPIAASFAVLASTTFVHLFEWSWPDVAKECDTFLGLRSKYPHQMNITCNQSWTRYQPVSYQLKSRGGDCNAFVDMVSRCKAAGVDIYVDAVTNHTAGVQALHFTQAS